MSIRINLLPHRETRREQRKKDFTVLLGAAGVVGLVLAALVAFAISGRIEAQQARNDFIKRENDKLDAQVKEIATLREEIDSLKSRQLAVENLQRDRTVPVHVMDELSRNTPEGMYFRRVRQVDRKVSIGGLAQSNEQVSRLLRFLAHETPWFERPELVEIKAITLPPPGGNARSGEGRRVFEFSLNATLKAADREGTAPEGAATGGKSGTTPKPAVPAKPARPVTQAPVNLAAG